MSVDFFDEGCDGFSFRVQLVETAQVGDKSDELVVDFSLIFGFFLFLPDFPFEDSDKLGFEEHFVESN